jgi:hypothetical protein
MVGTALHPYDFAQTVNTKENRIMNSPIDTLLYSLEASRMMFNRFTEDLKPSDYLYRPTPKANCAAWLIGHLVMAERRFGQRVDCKCPPLPDGFEKRYARDETAPFAADFGDVMILRPLFNSHRDATIAAVRAFPVSRLNEPAAPAGPTPVPSPFKTIGESVQFMCFHQVMHTGQITTIRRCLGRPPIV